MVGFYGDWKRNLLIYKIPNKPLECSINQLLLTAKRITK